MSITFTTSPIIKKSQLLKLLADLPDDANIYVFTKMASADRAVAAAKTTGGDDVQFCLANHTMGEANGVSLVAYCGE